jgi:hypothetical protein
MVTLPDASSLKIAPETCTQTTSVRSCHKSCPSRLGPNPNETAPRLSKLPVPMATSTCLSWFCE